jgi:hypothetical protein
MTTPLLIARFYLATWREGAPMLLPFAAVGVLMKVF